MNVAFKERHVQLTQPLTTGANQFKDAIALEEVRLLSGSTNMLALGFTITITNPIPNIALSVDLATLHMRSVRTRV